MPFTDFHPSSVKGGRRILSEKSANACLSPASQRHASPVKSALVDSPSPKKLLPSPSFVAQKRSFSQLDGGNSKTDSILRVQRVGSRVGAVAAPLHHGASFLSPTAQSIRPESDAMNLDEQTEQSQPQPLPQTNLSSNNAQPTPKEPQTTYSAQTVPSDPETRKLFIQEKAILLRNKLQNAMRHVCDPQFDRRLSELEEHSRKYARLSAPSLSPQGERQRTEGEEEEDVTSTPRAQQTRSQSQIHDDDEEEITPTQNKQSQHTNATGVTPSPMQMLLSSPTYNQMSGTNVQSGRFDDDRPREMGTRTDETLPSSSQRGEGDGDAVDGLLKLMSTGAIASAGTGR